MAKARSERPEAKAKLKPKLTDAKRHKRFVNMAREVGADERPEAFDKAFDRIVSCKSSKKEDG
jgi:hypothetical protein